MTATTASAREKITGRVEVTSVRDKPICAPTTSVRNAACEVCPSGTATTCTVPLEA